MTYDFNYLMTYDLNLMTYDITLMTYNNFGHEKYTINHGRNAVC